MKFIRKTLFVIVLIIIMVLIKKYGLSIFKRSKENVNLNLGDIGNIIKSEEGEILEPVNFDDYMSISGNNENNGKDIIVYGNEGILTISLRNSQVDLTALEAVVETSSNITIDSIQGFNNGWDVRYNNNNKKLILNIQANEPGTSLMQIRYSGTAGDGYIKFNEMYVSDSDFRIIPVNEMTKEITINKADPTFTVPTGLTAIYGQTLGDIELPTVDGGAFSWESQLTTSVGNAGTNIFTVRYTPTDTINYKIVTGIEVTVNVGKATYNMSTVQFNNKTVTYNGEEQKVEINGTLPTGVTVSYENNKSINAGTYNAIARFEGDSANYVTIENMTAVLKIEKANPVYTAPTGLKAKYGQTLGDVDLTSYNTEYGTYSWERPLTTSVGEVGEHAFTVRYTPEDKTNYNEISGIQVTVTVEVNVEGKDDNYTIETEEVNGETVKYIRGISGGDTIEEIKTKTGDNYIKLYEPDGETEITEDRKIGTGMKIEISGTQYEVVIIGDITGEGDIDIADLALLADYKLGIENEGTASIIGAKLKATDLNGNGICADIGDLAKLADILLNKVN